MSKVVFLDRDGTINYEVDVLSSVRQLRLIRGVADAIKKINNLGFLVIVITNQAVVARGLITEKELADIHKSLTNRLLKSGAKLDAIYYCPHHPRANIKKYRKECICRKPNIGMIERAIKDFKIDIKKSFLIGDATGDILTGQRAKLKTILVKTGYAGRDKKFDIHPDFVVKNLNEAVDLIKKNEK
jgi:D,D-heptose 1,7-bisphosphate phosphatase